MKRATPVLLASDGMGRHGMGTESGPASRRSSPCVAITYHKWPSLEADVTGYIEDLQRELVVPPSTAEAERGWQELARPVA